MPNVQNTWTSGQITDRIGSSDYSVCKKLKGRKGDPGLVDLLHQPEKSRRESCGSCGGQGAAAAAERERDGRSGISYGSGRGA